MKLSMWAALVMLFIGVVMLGIGAFWVKSVLMAGILVTGIGFMWWQSQYDDWLRKMKGE